jgi:hypothetical protein
MTTPDLRVRVLLTMQLALLGLIKPNVRAIACSWNTKHIFIHAIFDGEISDADRELMDELEAEVISHFPDVAVFVECVRLDMPERLMISSNEVCVYRRSE